VFDRVPQHYENDVPVDRLRAHPKNSKLHDVALIEQSMVQNGFAGAIYAQESTGYIISGHGTLETAKAGGMETVPVLWMELDDDAAERLLLAYNASVMAGGYDREKLAAHLESVQERMGLTGTGWNPDSMDNLLHDLEQRYTDPEEFDGGYVDNKTERKQDMTRGQLAPRGLHEIVCVFSDEQFERIIGCLGVVQNQLGGETTSEQVYNAVLFAADELERKDAQVGAP
jgi:hypothetical protein